MDSSLPVLYRPSLLSDRISNLVPKILHNLLLFVRWQYHFATFVKKNDLNSSFGIFAVSQLHSMCFCFLHGWMSDFKLRYYVITIRAVGSITQSVPHGLQEHVYAVAGFRGTL